MADQGPSAVPQPDAGQGEGGPSELHQQFLSSVPDNLREPAQQLVPMWDKHVQGKFQEAASFRKQWEPYEQLGLTNHQPETIQQALALHEVIQDPERLPQLYEQLGEYMQQQGIGGTEDPYEPEYGAEDGADYEGADPRLMQQLQQMQQQMSRYDQFIQQQQEQAAQEQAAQFVNSELEAIKKDNPSLTDDDMDYICSLALKYDSQDAVRRGFADYQKLTSHIEQGVFQNKTGAPDPANSGGSAATKPEPITSFEEAGKAALERFRAANGG